MYGDVLAGSVIISRKRRPRIGGGRLLFEWQAERERERAQMSLDALAYWRARFNASDSIYDQSAPPAIGQRRPILRLVLNKPGLTFWPPDMEQFSFWLSANPLPSCKQC